MYMDKNKLFFVMILSLFANFTVSASGKIVLQLGHDGMPIDMQWHEKTHTIVSVGEDGRLIVTHPRNKTVLHRFRVTANRIYNLALDPSHSKAAIVTFNNEVYTLSVWDWEKERKVLDYDIVAEPLFISWSSKGKYLIVGNLGSPGVFVFDGKSGRKLSYLQRLPSLYNAGYIGSTETTLMTYSVSGSIRYWDIRSSALKFSTETLPGLQGIKVLQTESKTTIFASKDNTLYLLNRQTGTVLDQLEISGMIDAFMDAQNGELDILATNMAGSTLYEYQVHNEQFLPRNPGMVENIALDVVPIQVDPSFQPLRIIRKHESTYLLSRTGRLFAENINGFAFITNDTLWKPDSMDFGNESFYLIRGNKILEFTSRFFRSSSTGKIEDLADIAKHEIIPGTLATTTGIKVLSGDIILQWDKSGDGGENGIRMMPFNHSRTQNHFPLNGPFEKIDILEGGRILTVNRSGTVNILNGFSGDIESTYSALGILDATYDDEGKYLLAGRSSRGRIGTPLERVDLKTKESIPIADRRFMIYSIVKGDSHIYSLGIEKNSRGMSTTLILRHDKRNPENSSTVFTVPGEDLNASVLPDPMDYQTIYTSLGGTVRKISRNKKIVFRWEERINQLALNASILYGLDRDGTLILWNAVTGRFLMKVYFFNDSGWIAISPGGTRIWASKSAMKNVRIYNNNGRSVNPSRMSHIVNDAVPFDYNTYH